MFFKKHKRYNYDDAIVEIKEKYFKEYLYFNNSKAAKQYFDKYNYTNQTFSHELQSTLICYSGDYCQAVNDYLNNRFEGETPVQYDARKSQWKKAIIEKCIKYLYNYNDWIDINDNVIAVRYLYLGKNSFRLTSKTLISCSLNLNVMTEVFARKSYFKGFPYFMGKADTLLFVLINSGTKILCYEQLNDTFAIKQSEILLSSKTEFIVLDTYRISNNQIKNIFIVTPKDIS